MKLHFLLCIILFYQVNQLNGNFVVPPLKLEELPRGIKISLPDVEGVSGLEFHGNINRMIRFSEEGDIKGSTTKKTGNFWVIEDQNVELKFGDTIYYKYIVTANDLQYRKSGLQWLVASRESFPRGEPACPESITVINKNQRTCRGKLLFEEQFLSPQLNESLWNIENRIPTYVPPDFEFCYYDATPQTLFIKESKLLIKPIAGIEEKDVRGVLNMTDRCKQTNPDECYLKQSGIFLLPPVKSARITSKFSFKYGRVEVKAKLPKGDWLYPQIILEPVSPAYGNRSGKMIVAFSRGNANLKTTSDHIIDSSALYGGVVLAPEEPKRSIGLKRIYSETTFNEETHTFSLIWKPGDISLLVDYQIYGNIRPVAGFSSLVPEMAPWPNKNAPFDQEFRLVLGVGVGGFNDFPDNVPAGIKPWKNRDRASLKHFFDNRNRWLATWQGDEAALQIESVKIFAI